MKNIFATVLISILDTFCFQIAFGQLSGTYTVGTTGYYSSLDEAFSRLSIDGINGSVTLKLTDTLYDATTLFNGTFKLIGPITGAGPSSRITIRPEDNVAVTLKGDGDAVMLFENVSYVTVDGVNRQGNTQLKVHALYNRVSSYNEGIIFTGNSDCNIVQNLTACTDDVSRMSGAIGFWGNTSGASDSCLVNNVFISSAGMGIYFIGSGLTSTAYRARGNIIRNNDIGSHTDSLIAIGIHDQKADETIIENNHIQNLRSSVLSIQNVQSGINVFAGKNTIVRNNLVHNLGINNSNSKTAGITASGGSTGRGNSVWIYNNKVWDISNNSPDVSELYGITAWYQDSMKIDFNTIVLSETNDNPPTSGSAAVHFQSTNFKPIIRNNILVNTRNDTPFVSVAVRSYIELGLSDYNDLYVGSSNTAHIGIIGSTNYTSFSDWKATSKDAHSVNAPLSFCTESLHIDTTNTVCNELNGKAIPIAGITTDFEGQGRHAAMPDIGADEFEMVAVHVYEQIISPLSFSLFQNFPNPFNPSTTIRYSVSGSSNVKLTIHDVLGREIAVLVDEAQSSGWKEAGWNATNISSGIYFYTLKAGSYSTTKKMILMK